MYNLDYFEIMLRQNSGSAKKINDIRWDFIKELNVKNVLDYGSGCGFFRAFAPKNVLVDTYDIGNFPQTGIKHDKYDLITFFDVLEHIDWENKPDKKIESILKKTKYIMITVPILPKGQDVKTWKHTKKGEHLIRFNKIEEVISFFEKRGFKCLKIGTPECPPRTDIFSFIFETNRPRQT